MAAALAAALVLLLGLAVVGYRLSGARQPTIDGWLVSAGMLEPPAEAPSDPTPSDPVEPGLVDPTPSDPVDPAPSDPVDPEPSDPVDPEPVEPEPEEPVEPEPEEPAEGGTDGPRTAEDYLRLAREAGTTDLGERYYRRALQLDPDEHHAMVGLGRLLIARGRHAEAVEPLRNAVRRRARRASYHLWFGDARAGAGDAAGARRSWERALDLDPDSREAQRRLGR